MKRNFFTALAGVAVLFAVVLFVGAIGRGGPSGRVFTHVTANADQDADFQTATMDLAEMSILYATVNAVEDSGTATVDITIQSSPDRTTWFTTGTAFTQLSATGTETKSITTGLFHRFVRYDVDFGGTGQYDIDLYTSGKP